MLGPTKNGESRYVPLLDRARQILEAIPPSVLNERVFTTPEGEPILPTWGKKPFYTTLDKMNRPRRTRRHDLRHTYATLLAEQGVPEEMLREWMGHKTLSVTRDYVNIDPIGPSAIQSFNLVNDLVKVWSKPEGRRSVVPIFSRRQKTS